MIFDPPLDETCLFLDVDGSLIDIAARPDAVEVPADLVVDLRRAETALHGALALVSGRSIAQLDRLFAPARFRASGVHGAETRLDPDGPTLGSDDDVIPEAVWTELSERLARYPGTLVENKRFSFAVHYRAVPEVEARLTSELSDLLAHHADSNLRLMPGHYVLEIKRASFDKGAAVRRFMAQPDFIGRKPVFIGDDVTDRPGFSEALAFGGVAYSVGPALPGTTGSFDRPTDVRRWIKQIAATETLHA